MMFLLKNKKRVNTENKRINEDTKILFDAMILKYLSEM